MLAGCGGEDSAPAGDTSGSGSDSGPAVLTKTLGPVVEGSAVIEAGQQVGVISDSVVIRGDLTVGGTLHRAGAGFTLQVEGDLRVEATGALRTELGGRGGLPRVEQRHVVV